MKQPTITKWIESNHNNIFKKFEDYCKHSDLFNKNRSVHEQDYTMLVGMILGFLHENGMGGTIDEGIMRKEIEKLQVKLTGKFSNPKINIFERLLP